MSVLKKLIGLTIIAMSMANVAFASDGASEGTGFYDTKGGSCTDAKNNAEEGIPSYAHLVHMSSCECYGDEHEGYNCTATAYYDKDN